MADHLTLEFPAASRYISTVRVTAAGLAAELDFDADTIDELRMGANELVALIIDAAEDAGVDRVLVRFVVGDNSIEVVTGFASSTAKADLEIDTLAKQILDAVVDDYSIDGSTLRLLKRRANARI